MKFILGLIFGMAVTFAGAWCLALAQSLEPAAQSVAQKMQQTGPIEVAETAPPSGEEIDIAPEDDLLQNPAATAASPATSPLAAQRDSPEKAENPDSQAQGSEQVWTLFHSEASASGFANYLSHSIDHPFVVTKLGPAQYEVSYSYTSSEQAQALAAKIEMITGAK
jgi:hypothetical protein